MVSESRRSPLPAQQQAILDRFFAACRDDARVVAAFLTGSYATGRADAHSDLDLGLITTDAAYDDFLADRASFIGLLGIPEFLESFASPHNLYFILVDGLEGELAVGQESAYLHISAGPYRVVLDKTGILDGVTFPIPEIEPAEQRETLRRLIGWFWHDLSHFITAMARGQLYWAQGQLDILRRMCVDLLRLRHNIAAPPDAYDKIDQAVPSNALAPLASTFCPLERQAMLRAAGLLVDLYRGLARPLAHQHGLPYSTALDAVMSARLNELADSPAAGAP